MTRMYQRLIIAAAVGATLTLGVFRVVLPYSNCRNAKLEYDRLVIQSQDKVGPGFGEMVAKAKLAMDQACSSG